MVQYVAEMAADVVVSSEQTYPEKLAWIRPGIFAVGTCLAIARVSAATDLAFSAATAL